jgi:pterin-4a-carbinolamine dehydratase
MTEITPRQFHAADGVEDWRVVGEGACANFRTGSFAAGARLVQAIGQLTGLEDHHPDVDLRYAGVSVRLITVTHETYGMSERDVELARQISAVARQLGVPADPSVVQTVQVTFDALVHTDVKRRTRRVRSSIASIVTNHGSAASLRTRPQLSPTHNSVRPAACLHNCSCRRDGHKCNALVVSTPRCAEACASVDSAAR